MNGGAIFLTIIINCVVIYFLHVLHKRSITKTVRHFRKEVEELENLVAAIIEELEEVAGSLLRVDKGEEIQPIKAPAFPEENEAWSMPMKQTDSESKEPSIEAAPIFQPQEISDPKHQRIFQLRQEGLAIEEIAKRLGIGRGEIQLILGIHRRS